MRRVALLFLCVVAVGCGSPQDKARRDAVRRMTKIMSLTQDHYRIDLATVKVRGTLDPEVTERLPQRSDVKPSGPASKKAAAFEVLADGEYHVRWTPNDRGGMDSVDEWIPVVFGYTYDPDGKLVGGCTYYGQRMAVGLPLDPFDDSIAEWLAKPLDKPVVRVAEEFRHLYPDAEVAVE